MTAEEPAGKAVANHEGSISERPDQPPPMYADLSAEHVEKRKVERYTGVLYGEEQSLFKMTERECKFPLFAPFASAGRAVSPTLQESGSPGRQT
jgi:hypothetical protein